MPETGNEQKEDNIKKTQNFFSNYKWEVISGILMLIGIIVAFFHRQIGGALIGLSLGIYFFEEIRAYFANMKEYHATHGTFKTLMIIGGALYFLLMIPAFLIAGVVGLALMYLLRGKKRAL